MRITPKGPLASRLRQRKFALLRQFPIPDDLLPGSLVLNHTRCGKPSCHCAKGKGHAAWSLVFMAGGKRRAQRIPKNGSRKSKNRSMQAVNFRMPCARCSPLTRNCWYWLVNNVIDERPQPTPPLDLRHAVPGFAVLFPISRRWSAPTTNPRQSFALVSVDRPSATRLHFSCRGKVGALLRTSCAGGEHVIQR